MGTNVGPWLEEAAAKGLGGEAQQRPARARAAAAAGRRLRSSPTCPAASARTANSRRRRPGRRQGLTLVHVRAQLEQFQDTLMSQVGLYGDQKSSS
jgi:hypothetical protein